jgi:tripartite-type tricarboxylate transporter receptor subunit TctC
MKNNLFRLVTALAIGVALLGSGFASAQDYPARPVTVVVPFSAGSASDVIARIALERMGTSIGRRFVVDNRPAAGGNVGTLAVTKAAPDGYTIVMTASGPLAANRTLYPNLGYDPERDLQPISMFASLPNVVVVSTKLPINSLAELTEYVKQKRNVPYGSVGNGSSQHLAGAFFEQMAGVQMTHVPYRVTAQLVSDLVGGEVPVSFQLVPNVIGQIKSGQVRPLAVASARRLSALPNVPTAAEAGIKGYESAAWFAFLAPRGTPRPIIDKLHAEVVSAMADVTVRSRFSDFGAEPMATTPEELARFISSEIVKWREIITKAAISIDP